jgi:hypothetical protein
VALVGEAAGSDDVCASAGVVVRSPANEYMRMRER